MENSRTKNSALILITSGFRQVISLILTFISRTVFIRILGAQYLGLNGLFTNILSLLALSELGVGTAISFYLYKPLAENDIPRIQLLMQFYKKCYRVVGCIILGIGCCLIPVLRYLVNLDKNVPENLYIIYLLYLFNTASSYLFFAYKQEFLTANQKQYKIESINIIFGFLGCICDIVMLVIFRDYIVYLLAKVILTLVKNLLIAVRIDREYPFLKKKVTENISKKEQHSFFSGLYQITVFRLGSQLLNATDNIIISIMLGTVIVGYYSNYYMIISYIIVFFGLIVRSFSAGIGNVIATESKEKQYKIYCRINFIAFAASAFCTVCLSQLLNSFVNLWIGKISSKYIFPQAIVIILVVNFYIDCSAQVLNSFRENSGNFKTGEWLQLIAGIVNIILSIILGKICGLAGIFAATIISKICITIIPFIINVSKDVFNRKPLEFLLEYLRYFLFTLVCMSIVWILCYRLHMTNMLNFVVECGITSVSSVLMFLVFFYHDATFIDLLQIVKEKRIKWVK